jgi:hypothetical protein
MRSPVTRVLVGWFKQAIEIRNATHHDYSVGQLKRDEVVDVNDKAIE